MKGRWLRRYSITVCTLKQPDIVSTMYVKTKTKSGMRGLCAGGSVVLRKLALFGREKKSNLLCHLKKGNHTYNVYFRIFLLFDKIEMLLIK